MPENEKATYMMTTTETDQPPRHLWLALEGTEIVELKQVVLDRDVPGAVAFFRRVLAPRVRQAVERRGITIDVSSGIREES